MGQRVSGGGDSPNWWILIGCAAGIIYAVVAIILAHGS
jgi:hypothetical protein